MSLLDRGCRGMRGLIPCLALQLVTVAACGAPPVDHETLEQRRKSIASLSDSKRQDLVRKYDQYQRLSVDERRKLEDIHTATEKDPGLKQVMDNYSNWLKNLDVTQREELRQAKTPEQKRNLVVQFHKVQAKQKDEAWQKIKPMDQSPPEKQGLFRRPLTSEELKKFMTALEVGVTKEGILDQATQSALSKSEGTQHYKLLLRAIGEYYYPEDGKRRQFELPISVKETWEEIIRHREGRQRLGEGWRIGPGSPTREQREGFFLFLAKSTFEEAYREFHGPEGNKLKETLFNSMSPDQQTYFSQKPALHRDQFLIGFHLGELRQAFIKAGNLPHPEGDGPGSRRPGVFPLPYKDGDENRRSRPLQDRGPDQPPGGRRPKPE